MNRILVIGGTGRVGGHVISQLPCDGVRVRALVRHPQSARLPAHVGVAPGDLALPETLDACLEGIDSVFLVWTAPPATVAAALERIAKQARRIVFLSAPLKTPHPFFQQPNPMRATGEQIERLIEASGCEWTFVRPGMISGNAVWWWSAQIRAGDVVRWPYLAAPTAPIDERDIAAVAVRPRKHGPVRGVAGNGHPYRDGCRTVSNYAVKALACLPPGRCCPVHRESVPPFHPR